MGQSSNEEGKVKNSNSFDDCNCSYYYHDYVYDMEMSQDIQARNILHWNYRNLREIPREVFQSGEHIQEIYLKRNCIVKLPSEIGKLRNLTNLYLIGNQLESLPEEIGQLKSLKVLDVSQNSLQNLPSSIGDLYELEELLITQNQIKILPEELRALRKLKYLEVTGNQIHYLDAEVISGLISLEDLAVDQNPIRFLPRSISHLRKLRYLSICHGKLQFLPTLPLYKFSQVNRNRQSVKPGEVCTREYLQFRFDGNPKLNYLPSWVPHFYGFNVDCYGCGTEDESRISSNYFSVRNTVGTPTSLPPSIIHLNFKGELHTLKFDEDIKIINRPRMKEPCSLFELSVRQIFKYVDSRKSYSTMRHWSHFLVPSKLSQLLNNGPTAECFQCEQKMFTQIWTLIFSLSLNNFQHQMLRLSTVSFCGSNCVKLFFTDSRSHLSSDIMSLCKFIVKNEIIW